jgi:hypothetical protein
MELKVTEIAVWRVDLHKNIPALVLKNLILGSLGFGLPLAI